MKKLFFLCLLTLFISCQGKSGSSPQAPAEDSVSPIQDETVVDQFMKLINSHRKGLGLKPLEHSERMALIAAEHSEDMAKRKVLFGHSGFSGRCTEARTVMGGGNLCAENVAMGQKTAEAVFNAWINSPSHKANIENERVTHTGLGFVASSSGTIYWTHLFLEKK